MKLLIILITLFASLLIYDTIDYFRTVNQIQKQQIKWQTHKLGEESLPCAINIVLWFATILMIASGIFIRHLFKRKTFSESITKNFRRDKLLGKRTSSLHSCFEISRNDNISREPSICNLSLHPCFNQIPTGYSQMLSQSSGLQLKNLPMVTARSIEIQKSEMKSTFISDFVIAMLQESGNQTFKFDPVENLLTIERKPSTTCMLENSSSESSFPRQVMKPPETDEQVELKKVDPPMISLPSEELPEPTPPRCAEVVSERPMLALSCKEASFDSLIHGSTLQEVPNTAQKREVFISDAETFQQLPERNKNVCFKESASHESKDHEPSPNKYIIKEPSIKENSIESEHTTLKSSTVQSSLHQDEPPYEGSHNQGSFQLRETPVTCCQYASGLENMEERFSIVEKIIMDLHETSKVWTRRVEDIENDILDIHRQISYGPSRLVRSPALLGELDLTLIEPDLSPLKCLSSFIAESKKQFDEEELLKMVPCEVTNNQGTVEEELPQKDTVVDEVEAEVQSLGVELPQEVTNMEDLVVRPVRRDPQVPQKVAKMASVSPSVTPRSTQNLQRSPPPLPLPCRRTEVSNRVEAGAGGRRRSPTPNVARNTPVQTSLKPMKGPSPSPYMLKTPLVTSRVPHRPKQHEQEHRVETIPKPAPRSQFTTLRKPRK